MFTSSKAFLNIMLTVKTIIYFLICSFFIVSLSKSYHHEEKIAIFFLCDMKKIEKLN